MLAAHNAAMLGEQTFEVRRENVSQANKAGPWQALPLRTLCGER